MNKTGNQVKKSMRKVLALLLIAAMISGLMPPLNVAAAANETEPSYQVMQVDGKEVVVNKTYMEDFSFPSFVDPGERGPAFGILGRDGKDLTDTCFYSDDYFSTPAVNSKVTKGEVPWTELDNQRLATMSIALAMSAFGSNVDNFSKKFQYWRGDYSYKYRNVEALLKKLDFTDFHKNDWFTKKPETDSIGMAEAQKRIRVTDPDGVARDYMLRAVAVRGAGYESEWASNVSIGSDPTNQVGHQGFNDAAQKVFKEIQKYDKEHSNEGLPVKYWIVGYSRAGATANLTSGLVTDNAASLNTTQNDVYGYTFEAPQGAAILYSNRSIKQLKYKNIHNIVNKMDLVPKVSPTLFGHQRLGIDYQLPYWGSNGNVSRSEYSQLKYRTRYNLPKGSGMEEIFMRYPDSKEGVDIYTFNILGLGTEKREKGTKKYQLGGLGKTPGRGGYGNQPLMMDEVLDELMARLCTSKAWGAEEADRSTNEAINKMTYFHYYQNDFRQICAWVMGGGMDGSSGIISKVLFGDFFIDIIHSLANWKEFVLVMNSSTWSRDSVLYHQKKTLYQKIKNMAERAVKGLGADEETVKAVRHVIPVFIEMMLYDRDDNYQNFLGTLLTYSGDLFTTHVPEVTFAWLKTLDDQYLTVDLQKKAAYTATLEIDAKNIEKIEIYNDKLMASWTPEAGLVKNPKAIYFNDGNTFVKKGFGNKIELTYGTSHDDKEIYIYYAKGPSKLNAAIEARDFAGNASRIDVLKWLPEDQKKTDFNKGDIIKILHRSSFYDRQDPESVVTVSRAATIRIVPEGIQGNPYAEEQFYKELRTMVDKDLKSKTRNKSELETEYDREKGFVVYDSAWINTPDLIADSGSGSRQKIVKSYYITDDIGDVTPKGKVPADEKDLVKLDIYGKFGVNLKDGYGSRVYHVVYDDITTEAQEFRLTDCRMFYAEDTDTIKDAVGKEVTYRLDGNVRCYYADSGTKVVILPDMEKINAFSSESSGWEWSSFCQRVYRFEDYDLFEEMGLGKNDYMLYFEVPRAALLHAVIQVKQVSKNVQKQPIKSVTFHNCAPLISGDLNIKEFAMTAAGREAMAFGGIRVLAGGDLKLENPKSDSFYTLDEAPEHQSLGFRVINTYSAEKDEYYDFKGWKQRNSKIDSYINEVEYYNEESDSSQSLNKAGQKALIRVNPLFHDDIIIEPMMVERTISVYAINASISRATRSGLESVALGWKKHALVKAEKPEGPYEFEGWKVTDNKGKDITDKWIAKKALKDPEIGITNNDESTKTDADSLGYITIEAQFKFNTAKIYANGGILEVEDGSALGLETSKQYFSAARTEGISAPAGTIVTLGGGVHPYRIEKEGSNDRLILDEDKWSGEYDGSRWFEGWTVTDWYGNPLSEEELNSYGINPDLPRQTFEMPDKDIRFSYKSGEDGKKLTGGKDALWVGLEDLPKSYSGDKKEEYFLRSDGGKPITSESVYEGAYIQLSAPETWNGKNFYCWQAYTRTTGEDGKEELLYIDGLAEENGAKTDFIMPDIGTDKRLYLAPVYLDDGQTVDFKVEGGMPIGKDVFRPGDIVYVKANEPGASYAFTSWNCNSDMAEIIDPGNMDSFVIIDRRAAGSTVTVKANYATVDYVVRLVDGPEPITVDPSLTVSEFISSLSNNAIVKGKAYSTNASEQKPEEVTVSVNWETEGLLSKYKTVKEIGKGPGSFEINGTLTNYVITKNGESKVMKLDGNVNRDVLLLVIVKGSISDELIPPTPTVEPGTYYSEQRIKFNVAKRTRGYFSDHGSYPYIEIYDFTTEVLTGKPGEVVTYVISTAAERNYYRGAIRYFTYVIDRRSEGRPGTRTISVNKADGSLVNINRKAGDKVWLYASDYIANSEDYVLNQWELINPGSLSRDGAVLTEDDYKDNILYFTMPDENVNLTPRFKKKIDKVYLDIVCSESVLPERAGWKVSENAGFEDDIYISWQTQDNGMAASFTLPVQEAMPGEGYASAFANSDKLKIYLKDDYDEFREISGETDPAANYYLNPDGDLYVKITYNDPSLIRQKDHAVYIECFDLGNEEYLAHEDMDNRVIISANNDETVKISAPLFTGDGKKLKGEVFDHWTLDDKIRLVSGSAEEKDITFVMPDGDVFLTANYVPVVEGIDLGFIAPKVGEHLPANILYMDLETNGTYSVSEEYTGLSWQYDAPDDIVDYDTVYTMKAFLKSDADGRIVMRKVVDENGCEVDGNFREARAAFKVAENAGASIIMRQFDKNGKSVETERVVPLVSDGNGGFYAEMSYCIEKEQAEAPDPDKILESNIDYDDALFMDSKDEYELYFPKEGETEKPSQYTSDVWVADNAMLEAYINKDIYVRTAATDDMLESDWVKVRLPERAEDVSADSISVDKDEESLTNDSGSVLMYSVWYKGMGETGDNDVIWFGRDDEMYAGQTMYFDELDNWDSISKMFFRRPASWDKPYRFAGKACEVSVNRTAAPEVEMTCDKSKKGTVSGQLIEKAQKTLEIEYRAKGDISWDYRAMVATDSEGWFEIAGLDFSPVVFRLRYPAGDGSFASDWTVTQPIEIEDTTELLPTNVVIKQNGSEVSEIRKTYGDPSFTLTAESADGSATNPKFTWSVSGPAIAKVSASGTNGEKGTVTINGAGTTVIKVDYKSAGNYGSAAVTLNVDKKGGVTITGLSAKNREYDGTMIAEVTGTPVINGILPADKDKVEVEYGYAEFENANAGIAKAVTFKEFALKGSASTNYALSAQPAPVTADITKGQYQDSEKVTLYRNEGDYKITRNLSDALPEDAVNPGYTAGSPEVKAGIISVSNFTVTSDGVLSADITDAREGARVILPVTISSTNFGDINYTVEMVIRKKERVTVSINQGASITKTYGDPSFTLTAALTPVTEIDLNDHTARIAWSSSDPTVAEVNEDSGEVKIRNAGSAKIKAEIESKTLSGNAEMDLTVNRKKVSVAGYYVEDKIYDGATGGTVKGEPVLNGLIGSDEVTVSASGTPAATFMDADNVKTQATVSDNCVVAFSGVTFSLNGADAVNYELDSSRQQPLAGRAAITERTVSVSGITVQDRYYEKGNKTVALKGCDTAVLSDIVASDSGRVALSYDEAEAVVDDANAGNGKSVTVTGLGLTGDMAYNYILTEPEFTVNILKAKTTEIQKTLSINQLYEDTDVKISVAGLMPEDAGRLSYDITEPAVATEDISVSGFKVGSDGLVTAKLTIANERKTGTVTLPVNIHSENYEDVGVTVIVNIIDKKRAMLSLIRGGDTITSTYGDPDFDLASVITVEGDTGGVIKGVSYDPTVADIAYEGTGSGKVEITGGGKTTIWAEYESADYYGSMDFTLIVNKKAVTVSGVKANDKVYDGSVAATVDISEAKIEGVLDKDSADKKGKDYLTIEVGTAAFNNKHTGKDKTVECKGFSLGGEGAYDYVLVKQPALKASVTKRPITVKLTAYGRTYTPSYPIVELTVDSVSGIVDNEVVLDTKDLIGIIDEPDVGTHEVTVEGLELKSNTPDGDPKDYTIIKEPSTLTVDITKANLGGKSTFNVVRTYLAGETGSEKFNLAALLPRENSSDDYEVTYFVSEVEGNLVFAGEAGKPNMDDDILSYTLTGEKSDSEAGHAHFSVVAVMQNYDNYIFDFDLKLSELALYEKVKTGYAARESWQLLVGRNVTLVPVFNGNIADKKVVYESSDPSVASIDQKGKLMGISAGETVISATSQFLNDGKNYTASITVHVNDPVSKVILSRNSYKMGVEDAVVIEADILPRTALNKLKWTWSGSGEVTLRPAEDNMKCVVTGKKEGTVKVTAQSLDGSGVKAVCSIKIGKPVGEFMITPGGKKKALEVGKKLNMKVNWAAKPANKDIFWSVATADGEDCSNIATINSKGVLKGYSEGEVVVTAFSVSDPSKKAQATIPVYVPIKKVSLSANTEEMNGEVIGLQINADISSKIEGMKATGVNLYEVPTVRYSIDPAYKKYIDLDEETGFITLADGASDKSNIPVKATVTAFNGYKKNLTYKISTGALKSIKLSSKKLSIDQGMTVPLTAKVNALSAGTKIEWSASPEGYVTINGNGTITGEIPGTAIVTVTAKNGKVTAKAECKVTVGPAVEGISFKNGSKLKNGGLAVNKSFTLKPEFSLTGNGKPASSKLIWKSSDPSVAEVNEKGVIKAVSAGRVTVTAVLANNEEIREELEFSVYVPVKKIIADRKKLTIATATENRVGLIYVGTVTPQEATNKDIIWRVTSGKGKVKLLAVNEPAIASEFTDKDFEDVKTDSTATVGTNQTLAVYAVAPGTVKLTGMTMDGTKKKVNCTVTIRGTVTGLALSETAGKDGSGNITKTSDGVYSSNISAGKSVTLKPVVIIDGVDPAADKKTWKLYKKYTDTTVFYRSSDINVATVDSKGKVTVIKTAAAGKTVTISANSVDGRRNTLNVTVK